MNFKEGTVVVTTMSLVGGAIVAELLERASECNGYIRSCELSYVPVFPIQPEQQHVPYGENIAQLPTTLNFLSASGGPMSNVHSQYLTGSSGPGWILVSLPETYDHDSYMASVFRLHGIELIVQREPVPASSTTRSATAAEQIRDA